MDSAARPAMLGVFPYLTQSSKTSPIVLSLSAQLATFAGISVLCMAAVRPLFVKFIYRRSDPSPVNIHALIGQSASVVDAIGAGDDPGRVKVGSEEWRAINAAGDPLPPGTRVEIIGVESATLTVRPR